MAVAIETFSESDSKNYQTGKSRIWKISKLMFLAFQESLSENSLKVLFNKANSLDNCEIAPEKMVNPASFSTVSFSTKNTDKKV